MATPRQHHGNKRTLFHLETLLAKSGLSALMMDIEVKREGVDFYCRAKNQAEKLAEFIASQMPCKLKSSKKLVSEDRHNNTGKYEHTIFIELASLSRDDLVITPRDVTHGLPELLLVSKITSSLHFINPLNLNKIEVNASRYFANPFPAFLTTAHLVPFMILDITPLAYNQTNRKGNSAISAMGRGDTASLASTVGSDRRGVLAEAEVICLVL